MGRWGGVGKGTFWYLVEFWERQKKVGWAQDYQGKDSFGLNSWAEGCGLFPSSCCEHAPSSWLGLPNCSVWKRWEIKKTHALGEGGKKGDRKGKIRQKTRAESFLWLSVKTEWNTSVLLRVILCLVLVFASFPKSGKETQELRGGGDMFERKVSRHTVYLWQINRARGKRSCLVPSIGEYE